ncbi:unnamed protein product [Merluccius merluccius]
MEEVVVIMVEVEVMEEVEEVVMVEVEVMEVVVEEVAVEVMEVVMGMEEVVVVVVEVEVMEVDMGMEEVVVVVVERHPVVIWRYYNEWTLLQSSFALFLNHWTKKDHCWNTAPGNPV